MPWVDKWQGKWQSKWQGKFAGPSVIQRYLWELKGSSHATITTYTTVAGDIVEDEFSVTADIACNISDYMTRAVGGALTVSSGSVSPTSVAADSVIRKYTWSGMTAGTSISVLGASAGLTNNMQGIFKSRKITNGGVVKHNWQIDTNTGYFIDKANPIADIYVDNAVVLGNFTSGDWLNGVNQTTQQMTMFTGAKYEGLVTADWIGMTGSASGVDISCPATSPSNNFSYSSTSTDAQVQAAFENPNTITLDWSGATLTADQMAKLRQDAGDPVGVITGSVTYIHVKKVPGGWENLDPPFNTILDTSVP